MGKSVTATMIGQLMQQVRLVNSAARLRLIKYLLGSIDWSCDHTIAIATA